MGRYYGSEALRNPKLQKKAIDYALDQLNPMIQNVGSQALNQLSTKIRPKKKYKTNRKDLDGGSLDIHNAILKVAPKKGFVMPGHRYTGPGNPLDKQLKYNPNTGQILEIYEEPTGRTDAVSMQHDVDYSVCGNKPKSDQIKCKNEADRKMVKALDSIPWKERQWGHTVARNAIAAKAKLGLGVKKRKTIQTKFKIGDMVRISKYKRKVFDKGYTPNWSEEVFTVDKIQYTNPITFKLKDLRGEDIQGSFYEPELLEAIQDVFRIDKVIRRDYKKKQALVKWKGYSDDFNSWIPIKDLKDL